MISFTVLFWMYLTHWFADFVCQTDWMARNKSKQNYPLFIHTLVYSLLFIPFAYLFLPPSVALWFVFFTGFLHFMVDYYSSRVTSKLVAANKYGSKTFPNFGMFTVIGFDQFLHNISLVGVYLFLLS